MDLRIMGRTAVVSGAAGAIAYETAKILLPEGCKLLTTDLDQDEMATSVEKLNGSEAVRSVVTDLSTIEGAQKVQTDGVRGDAD